MREKRLLDILNIVRKNGYATTQELADALNVSLSTVRRDIAELSENSLVSLSRNIVVPVAESAVDRPLNFRSGINAQAKQAISREAVRLVRSGSTIFLDSSSTVLPMVNMLQTLNNLTIITNGLHVVQRLQDSRVTVHVIGGEMSALSHGFYGPITESTLRQFNFDMAFFSPVGVTPAGYAAETTAEAASVRRTAMEQSACSVLMFDHTKAGLVRPYNFAHIDEFQYLITDSRHEFVTAAQLRRVNV